MKLRRKDPGQRHSSEGSAKRRKRGKRATEDVWYHNVAPVFDEPISDDFLGLVGTPGDAEPAAEQPSVQVSVERTAPPVSVPADLAPDADLSDEEPAPPGADDWLAETSAPGTARSDQLPWAGTPDPESHVEQASEPDAPSDPPAGAEPATAEDPLVTEGAGPDSSGDPTAPHGSLQPAAGAEFPAATEPAASDDLLAAAEPTFAPSGLAAGESLADSAADGDTHHRAEPAYPSPDPTAGEWSEDPTAPAPLGDTHHSAEPAADDSGVDAPAADPWAAAGPAFASSDPTAGEWPDAPTAAGASAEPLAASDAGAAPPLGEPLAGAAPLAEPPVPQRPFVHDGGAPPAADPPMIIPVRGYYMTRPDDTLRSVSAQFLNTPSRWQELRSLNVAAPGVAGASADSLLPVGTALALPGDPMPWGRPDPVYLWTLAERFLYAAWGREPTPEEVVPFWRGLTGGAGQLDMGAAPPLSLAEPAEPPIPPAMQPPQAPTAEARAEPAPSLAELAEPPIPPAMQPPQAPTTEPPITEAPAAPEPTPSLAAEAEEPAGFPTPPAPAPSLAAEAEEPAGFPTPPAPAPSLAAEAETTAEAGPRAEAEPPIAPEAAAPLSPAEAATAADAPGDEASTAATPPPPFADAPTTSPPWEESAPPDLAPSQPAPYADAPPPLEETAPTPPASEAPPGPEAPPVPAAYGDPAMAPPDEPPLPAPSPEPPVAAPYAEAPAPPPLAEPDEPDEDPTAADAAEAPPAEAHSPVSPAATAAPFEEEPVAPSEPPFAHAPAAGSLPPPFTEAPVAPHAPEVAPPAIYEPPPVPSAHESPPPATAPSPEPPVAPPYAEAPPPPEEPAAPAYPPPMAEEPAAPAIPPAPSAYGPPPAPPAAPPYEPPASPPPAPAPSPAMPDLGPVEPDVDRPRETEAPPLPAFMPSLTGATPSAELPVEEVVASSQRVLAGTAIGDAMMLWQLGRLRRRGRRRDAAPDPLELSLEQTARMDSLRLIEAAMRHLRATTVAKLLPKPRVICVRTGAYGLEILLEEPVKVPEGWQSASGGYVLELPREVSVEELDAAGPGLSLCPALVPVGDTAEGPLLLNLEEISCLAVSGPSNPTASLLTSVVEVLGSSPLAGDIRIITVGISAPSGPGWERIHALSFDSPHLENLLATADSPAHAGSSDVLVIGPGNDLLFQRAGQIATSPGSRLMLVGATSSVAARWPWRIHVDEQHRAVVHPIAVNINAAQAMRPELAYLLSEAGDDSLTAPRLP